MRRLGRSDASRGHRQAQGVSQTEPLVPSRPTGETAARVRAEYDADEATCILEWRRTLLECLTGMGEMDERVTLPVNPHTLRKWLQEQPGMH